LLTPRSSPESVRVTCRAAARAVDERRGASDRGGRGAAAPSASLFAGRYCAHLGREGLERRNVNDEAPRSTRRSRLLPHFAEDDRHGNAGLACTRWGAHKQVVCRVECRGEHLCV
jgi:hypothetical protein